MLMWRSLVRTDHKTGHRRSIVAAEACGNGGRTSRRLASSMRTAPAPEGPGLPREAPSNSCNISDTVCFMKKHQHRRATAQALRCLMVARNCDCRSGSTVRVQMRTALDALEPVHRVPIRITVIAAAPCDRALRRRSAAEALPRARRVPPTPPLRRHPPLMARPEAQRLRLTLPLHPDTPRPRRLRALPHRQR